MKSRNRAFAGIAALIILTVAGLVYRAGDQMRIADVGAQTAREASLQSYRVAQSLKALTAGYELTLNEYYSTVLDFPAYEKKAAEQKAALAHELATLSTLPDGDDKAVSEISRLYKEIDTYRLDLEKALSATGGPEWDRAREALYKVNVLSVQAIHRADELGKFANDRALTLDKSWQASGSQAVLLLRAATILALIAGVALLLGTVLRPSRASA